MPLPGLDAGSYNALIGTDDGVLYFSGGTLSRYKLEDRKSEEIITRMAGRRVHPGSRRTYHVTFNPPTVADRDDATGEPLIQRDDDQAATVRKRLQVYRAQTQPLIAYYRQWAATADARAPKHVEISGSGGVEEIRDRAFAALDAAR